MKKQTLIINIQIRPLCFLIKLFMDSSVCFMSTWNSLVAVHNLSVRILFPLFFLCNDNQWNYNDNNKKVGLTFDKSCYNL